MIPLIILAIENDGDRDFMIQLYTDFYPLMRSTAINIVKDINISEDMIHDSIAKLIEKIDVIRTFERKRLVSYIVTTVSNTAINHYNKYMGGKRISFYGMENDMADNIVDYSTSFEESFDIREEYRELGMAVNELREKEKQLLYLKYNLEKSDQEIGEILGIKKDSVREYLTRARRRVKKNLEKEMSK